MLNLDLQFFGGRGASSGGGSNYKMNNPAGIPSNAMTLQEFMDLNGVGDAASGVGIDRYAGANMTRMTTKARQKTLDEIKKGNDSYYEKRKQVREEYERLIKKGVIRDKTSIEKTITKAHGNPDLQSTQAARRMATKKGIDWRTGKRI